jgi:uncharacterized membrane protein YkvA (DUF1232 family)
MILPMSVPSLRQLKDHALKVAQNPERLQKILSEADAKAKAQHSRIRAFWEELKLLLRFVKAWIGGQYRDVPWQSLLAAVGALLYFLNPLDLIPDFIYGFGFLDDALVVGLVIRSIQGDLERFRAWESGDGRF